MFEKSDRAIARLKKSVYLFILVILITFILPSASSSPIMAQENIDWPPFELDIKIEPLANDRVNQVVFREENRVEKAFAAIVW